MKTLSVPGLITIAMVNVSVTLKECWMQKNKTETQGNIASDFTSTMI